MFKFFSKSTSFFQYFLIFTLPQTLVLFPFSSVSFIPSLPPTYPLPLPNSSCQRLVYVFLFSRNQIQFSLILFFMSFKKYINLCTYHFLLPPLFLFILLCTSQCSFRSIFTQTHVYMLRIILTITHQFLYTGYFLPLWCKYLLGENGWFMYTYDNKDKKIKWNCLFVKKKTQN